MDALMTRAERSELAGLARTRAPVAKAQVPACRQKAYRRRIAAAITPEGENP